MAGDTREGAIQVHVPLPNHWAADGETLWAKPVDGGLELRNAPFYAYGLNFRDVVAVEEQPEGPPVVVSVVRPSGHRTLRLILSADASNRAKKKLRRELEALSVALDVAADRYAALDLPPEVDMGAVRDLLDGFEEDGVLDYETANERVPGSFDAAAGIQL